MDFLIFGICKLIRRLRARKPIMVKPKESTISPMPSSNAKTGSTKVFQERFQHGAVVTPPLSSRTLATPSNVNFNEAETKPLKHPKVLDLSRPESGFSSGSISSHTPLCGTLKSKELKRGPGNTTNRQLDLQDYQAQRRLSDIPDKDQAFQYPDRPQAPLPPSDDCSPSVQRKRPGAIVISA